MEAGEQMKEAGVEAPSGKETMNAVWNLLTTGKTGHERETAENMADEVEHRAALGTGGAPSPVPSARFDVTADQRAAAEAFWDVWRSGNYTNEEFDAAYSALQAAFEGSESTFSRLDEWLDKLHEALSDEKDGLKNQTDLPATWWKNPGTSGDAVTGSDLRAFNGLPAAMQAASDRRISSTVSTRSGRDFE